MTSTCSLATSDVVVRKVFQAWLDSQPLPNPGDNNAPSDSTLYQAITFPPESASVNQRDIAIIPSIPFDTARTPVASTSGTVIERPIYPPLPLTSEAILASGPLDRDGSHSTDAKRPRDAASTENNPQPDKAAKTAHIHDNTSLPSPPFSPDEPNPDPDLIDSGDLLGYEEKTTRDHEDVITTVTEATKIIRNMMVEHKRLLKDFMGYRMMSGSLVTKAAEEELLAERRSTDHEMELAMIKNQLEITQAQLKGFVDKAGEIDQVEKGRRRDSDSLEDNGLKCQLQEMESQYTAAVRNADTSRKARNETQTNLATTQAENARLHEQIATMTANHDYETIELSELRAENKRLRAEVVDLAKVKADLQTTQVSLDQHLADRTRLDIELEDGKDEIDRLKSKLRVHTDVDPDLHRKGL